jgi:hypothetical protein
MKRSPITAQLAEAEPEQERLFNQPTRPVSPALRALLDRIAAWGENRKEHQHAGNSRQR